MNDGDFEGAFRKPVYFRSPFLEFKDEVLNEVGLDLANPMPSPRVIKSHLPVQLMPRQVRDRKCKVLLDFSLTVKAATFIFISGRGSAISSAKEGKSGSISNLVKNQNMLYGPRKRECILTVYTLNSHLLTLKAHNHKMYVFFVVR